MSLTKTVRWSIQVTGLLLLVYLGIVLLVFFEQRRFIYHPVKMSAEAAISAAQTRGYEPWRNNSGEIIGWKQISRENPAHNQLLILHGNGGCAIYRLSSAKKLQEVEPLDVYVLEYPGYGNRAGVPTQKSLFHAADEGMNLLKTNGPVYVLGESLGTGVASYLAGTYPDLVRGVFLVAPYNELTEVAAQHMPYFPVSWMLRDRFPSATYLKHYHGPIAMLFGGRDIVVPNQFGHKLYDGYAGPKRFWQIPEAGHSELFNRPEAGTRWRDILSFWKSGMLQIAK